MGQEDEYEGEQLLRAMQLGRRIRGIQMAISVLLCGVEPDIAFYEFVSDGRGDVQPFYFSEPPADDEFLKRSSHFRLELDNLLIDWLTGSKPPERLDTALATLISQLSPLAGSAQDDTAHTEEYNDMEELARALQEFRQEVLPDESKRRAAISYISSIRKSLVLHHPENVMEIRLSGGDLNLGK